MGYVVVCCAEQRRNDDCRTALSHCSQAGPCQGEMLEGTRPAVLGCGKDGTAVVVAIRHDGHACSPMLVHQSSRWTY